MLNILAVFLTLQTLAQEPDPIVAPPPKDHVPANLILIQKALVADKSTRTLTLWESRGGRIELIKAYPMDIGKMNGDKLKEGDHRTPNGIYYPQRRLEKNELNFNEYGIRAFTLDYPNFFDQRARKSGSGIWIHAIPDTTSLFRGSRGCVVVRNSVIDELTPHIGLGRTAVVITERVDYLPRDKHNLLIEKSLGWLESWRTSWVNKEIDNYINFYADDFKAMNMNKKQWRRYKQSLNKRYNKITVQIDNPLVLANEGQKIVRFEQTYQSDVISDKGVKTLFLDSSSSSPLILSEQWHGDQLSATTSQTQALQSGSTSPEGF
jgi:murein L,D-transpeptidase YafK